MNYNVADNALVKTLDDGAMALNTATGAYYSLNETAAQMWLLMEEGHSDAEIVETIVTQYEVLPQVVEGDLSRLIRDLLDLGLVTERTGME